MECQNVFFNLFHILEHSTDSYYSQTAFFSGFLEKLSPIAEFSLNSQIIHFVKLQREPPYDQTYQHFYFLSSSVPHILPHPNEWNSDFISTNQQSLHFTVYIPPRSSTPLYLRNQHGLLFFSHSAPPFPLGPGGALNEEKSNFINVVK